MRDTQLYRADCFGQNLNHLFYLNICVKWDLEFKGHLEAGGYQNDQVNMKLKFSTEKTVFL